MCVWVGKKQHGGSFLWGVPTGDISLVFHMSYRGSMLYLIGMGSDVDWRCISFSKIVLVERMNQTRSFGL